MGGSHAHAHVRLRRTGALAVALAVVATTTAAAAPSAGDLQQKIDSAQQRERDLQSTIRSESGAIGGMQGKVDDLTTRQRALEQTLAFERRQLEQTQMALRDARARLTRLQAQLKADKAALAAQLVAQYKTPQDDIVTVVVNAHGFSGLIEKVDDMKRLRDANTTVTVRVGQAQAAVQKQTDELAALERRRQQIANATLVQRDEVARLRIAAVDRQLVVMRARRRNRDQLSSLQSQRNDLQRQLSKLQAAAAEAAKRAGSSTGSPGQTPVSGGGSFAAHGGAWGFFQAPGTNYSVGDEPRIAARLDQLGKALQLHLIGISGYRSPQHSVAVGGFPNDPHTRGQASDTPGVEGVPEATLEQFGLTRPFGGAAEADHIQLLGSI